MAHEGKYLRDLEVAPFIDGNTLIPVSNENTNETYKTTLYLLSQGMTTFDHITTESITTQLLTVATGTDVNFQVEQYGLILTPHNAYVSAIAIIPTPLPVILPSENYRAFFDEVLVDRNNNYDAVNSIFHAPSPGVYHVVSTISMHTPAPWLNNVSLFIGNQDLTTEYQKVIFPPDAFNGGRKLLISGTVYIPVTNYNIAIFIYHTEVGFPVAYTGGTVSFTKIG